MQFALQTLFCRCSFRRRFFRPGADNKTGISVIDQFRELPVAKVMLTGGEVMVRKDLECIVEYMRHKNKDIVIDITTNALLLTDETIKTLQACRH